MLGINQDLFVILLIAAAIFGAKKLPEIGKGIGQGIKEFKEGLSGTNEEAKPVPPKQIEGENKENK